MFVSCIVREELHHLFEHASQLKDFFLSSLIYAGVWFLPDNFLHNSVLREVKRKICCVPSSFLSPLSSVFSSAS